MTVQRAYAVTVCSLVAMIATTALRHVSNRLVGILHGCLATHTTYDEATAWSHHTAASAA
ncbi:hypothetical protein C8D88_12284 [Lentzea atacamensis]|uniref:Uncharacterized protein n=1 Tax=Lentzea atacamensis TaxID=531938 RepID=A0A316HK03_9PSEU|nr:hypothetical protein [Lentzea atacamensis]PWK80806.1 hypothetical protein C8D88_12284 [Lentzea atacamensis]